MDISYKYNPEDFKNTLGMSEDLITFYRLLEIYYKDRTEHSWFPLKKHWEDLFFTIKHREVEGFLNPVFAQEIRDYLEELAND